MITRITQEIQKKILNFKKLKIDYVYIPNQKDIYRSKIKLKFFSQKKIKFYVQNLEKDILKV